MSSRSRPCGTATVALIATLLLAACATSSRPRAAGPAQSTVASTDLATEFSAALAGTPAEVMREGRHLRIVLPARMLFVTDAATVAPTAAVTLAPLLQRLAEHRGLHVNLRAHTDSIGSQAFNEEFSRQRAAALRLWLMEQGVPDAAIEAHGLGETVPLADNSTPAGRERNRRVELILGPR